MTLKIGVYLTDDVARLFRAAHTLKGSSGVFGFERLSKFTHAVETHLDEFRGSRAGPASRPATTGSACWWNRRRKRSGCGEAYAPPQRR